MRCTLNRLKPLAVDKAKTPDRYADGGGLYPERKRSAPRKVPVSERLFRDGTATYPIVLSDPASKAHPTRW